MADDKTPRTTETLSQWPEKDFAYFPTVDPETDNPSVKPIFDAMREAGFGPLNIHLVLAHASEFYPSFHSFANALRGRGETSRADRELVILRTVQLRGAEYEFIQHRRIALSLGITTEQVDGLNQWRDLTYYDSRQRVLLAFTDDMISNGSISAPVWGKVVEALSPAEVVELALCSAFYTAVAQFTHAIPIQPETRVTKYGE